MGLHDLLYIMKISSFIDLHTRFLKSYIAISFGDLNARISVKLRSCGQTDISRISPTGVWSVRRNTVLMSMLSRIHVSHVSERATNASTAPADIQTAAIPYPNDNLLIVYSSPLKRYLLRCEILRSYRQRL
jgi:hypothetical protein